MEPHSNAKLLLISLCLIISVSTARSARLAPDLSPTPQPVASPSPSPSPSEDVDFSAVTVDFFPISDSPSEFETEPIETDPASENKRALGIDFSSDLHAVSADAEVKKICDQTDYPSLCLATVLPNIKGKPNVDSVLQVAVEAGSKYAKQALSEAKNLIEKPGTPADLLSTLKDCKDGYDTAVDNFQKTLDAFAVQDIGTMRSMLSAVITVVGDCQDQFKEMEIDSPFSNYAEKLTEMASNCLAISSLKN